MKPLFGPNFSGRVTKLFITAIGHFNWVPDGDVIKDPDAADAFSKAVEPHVQWLADKARVVLSLMESDPEKAREYFRRLAKAEEAFDASVADIVCTLGTTRKTA